MFEEAGKKSYSVMSSEGITAMNLNFLINEHNNKAFDLTNNYILLKYYFDKGIPDEEWVIEDNGKYKFFPHMEEKHDAYKYWFDFYMDSFYKRFATFIDTVCHLIILNMALELNQLQVLDKRLWRNFEPKMKHCLKH